MAETVGDRIRQLRGSLSQIEFASRLQADKNTIGRYERCERTPDGEFLLRLQMEFGVSIDWLLTGVGQVRSGGDAGTPAVMSQAPIDEELYGRVMEAVSSTYKECGYAASLRQVAARAARIAASLTTTGGTPEQQSYGLALSIDQLRRDLRSAVADPSSSVARNQTA